MGSSYTCDSCMTLGIVRPSDDVWFFTLGDTFGTYVETVSVGTRDEGARRLSAYRAIAIIKTDL